MPRIGGPNSSKRAVLCGVAHSVLLYGAPIWADALKIKKNRMILERTQRKALIRVGAAFKTVSTVALQVITGIAPIDLMVEERKEAHELGQNETTIHIKERTLEKWQQRWNNNRDKGQWTKRLIPDLEKWLKCGHRNVDYYITQAITGHGMFRTYSKRFKKTESDRCVYCGMDDTPEHTIFVCENWRELREEVCNNVGNIKPENLIEKMIQTKENWQTIHRMLKEILKTKEEAERTGN